MTTRQIERRASTAEPLVEVQLSAEGAPGAFVPAGRRERTPMPAVEGQSPPYPDGLNSYALDTDHETAYNAGVARLDAIQFGSTPPRPSDYRLAAEDAALLDAGIAKLATESAPASINQEAADRFLGSYREVHPWPTSFPTLLIGDPANNLELVPNIEPVAADSTTASVSTSPDANHETQKAAPVAQPIEPPSIVVAIPDGNAHVDVPAAIAEQLPAGTLVSLSPGKTLFASVPHEGRVHHIVADLGNEFHHLVASVRAALHF